MPAIPNRLAVVATVLAASAALAGLVIPGLYVDAPNWVQQAQGTDLATLFLAVPVLILGLSTASRGSSTGVLPPDLIKAGISSNPVYALDLAFFLPLSAIAGIGLVRRNGAAAFAFPMLVWVPLMGGGVVGGMLLMAIAGDSTALPIAVVITALGVVSATLAAAAIVRPRAGAARISATTRPAAQEG
jgi:hypothetical protein